MMHFFPFLSTVVLAVAHVCLDGDQSPSLTHGGTFRQDAPVATRDFGSAKEDLRKTMLRAGVSAWGPQEVIQFYAAANLDSNSYMTTVTATPSCQDLGAQLYDQASSLAVFADGDICVALYKQTGCGGETFYAVYKRCGGGACHVQNTWIGSGFNDAVRSFSVCPESYQP